MAKRSLRGALALGALALAGNAYAEGAEANSLESSVISTFSLPGTRGELKGVSLDYEVMLGKDGIYARRKDEPQTRFFLTSYYDMDNDKEYGAMENKMIEAGIPMHMTKEFTYKVLEAYLNYLKEQPTSSPSLDEEQTSGVGPDQDSESAFPDFYVGLNRQALKTIGLSKLGEYQSPEMSKKEARRIEKERFEELLRKDFSNKSKPIPGQKKHVPISLVAGARIIVPTYTLENEEEVKRFALANGLYGGELGIKIGKYFGLTGNISAGLDRRVTDVKELIDPEMFPGIYGITKGDMTRLLSLGISAEGYIPFSDFFSWLISLEINTQSSTYTVENSKTGPDGQIGVPMLDKPKDNRLISLSAATGAELKLSYIVRLSALVGAQVPFKEDEKKLDGTWSNNPAGIDFSKITPSLALRLAFLLNGGN